GWTPHAGPESGIVGAMLRRSAILGAIFAVIVVQIGPGRGLPGATAATAPTAGAPAAAVTAVSAGYDHTCALRGSGLLRCWGRDSFGEVSGPNKDGGNYVAVSVGGFHTCAIRPDHTLKCWGRDDSGQDRKSTRLNSSHLVISYA